MRLRPAFAARVATVLLGAVAAAAAVAGPHTPLADVIPLPAEVVPQPGAFVLRAGVAIVSAKAPGVRRVAAYFAELLDTSHGLKLKVRAPAGGRDWAVVAVDPVDLPGQGPAELPDEVVRHVAGRFAEAAWLWRHTHLAGGSVTAA